MADLNNPHYGEKAKAKPKQEKMIYPEIPLDTAKKVTNLKKDVKNLSSDTKTANELQLFANFVQEEVETTGKINSAERNKRGKITVESLGHDKYSITSYGIVTIFKLKNDSTAILKSGEKEIVLGSKGLKDIVKDINYINFTLNLVSHRKINLKDASPIYNEGGILYLSNSPKQMRKIVSAVTLGYPGSPSFIGDLKIGRAITGTKDEEYLNSRLYNLSSNPLYTQDEMHELKAKKEIKNETIIDKKAKEEFSKMSELFASKQMIKSHGIDGKTAYGHIMVYNQKTKDDIGDGIVRLSKTQKEVTAPKIFNESSKISRYVEKFSDLIYNVDEKSFSIEETSLTGEYLYDNNGNFQKLRKQENTGKYQSKNITSEQAIEYMSKLKKLVKR